MKQFEIYFNDLKPKVRKLLLEEFETTRDNENWDVQPLTVIYREVENDEFKG